MRPVVDVKVGKFDFKLECFEDILHFFGIFLHMTFKKSVDLDLKSRSSSHHWIARVQKHIYRHLNDDFIFISS